MILHITFTDGANPWVSYGEPEKLAKIWKKWAKWDKTARCHFFSKPDGLQCRARAGGGYSVGQYFDGAYCCKDYEYLLPALKCVEKGVL